MQFLILLCCVWLAGAGTVPEKCDGVTFDGKYYDKEVLLTISGADEFTYVKSINTLFFSYTLPEGKSDDQFYGIGTYNFDTKEFAEFPQVPGGTVTTIDPKTGDLYLAGGDGIYKYNPITKHVERYTAKGVPIFSMFFNDELFYATKPNFEFFSYNDGVNKKLTEVQVHYVSGDRKEYFFVNGTGIFSVLDDKEENAVKLADPVGHTYYRAFARDNNNKIYVINGDGVYVPSTAEKKLDRAGIIKDIQGFAFDKENNIIYSDDKHIIRLTPSEANCTPSA